MALGETVETPQWVAEIVGGERFPSRRGGRFCIRLSTIRIAVAGYADRCDTRARRPARVRSADESTAGKEKGLGT